jgi:hypothetical protein
MLHLLMVQLFLLFQLMPQPFVQLIPQLIFPLFSQLPVTAR